MGGGRPGNSSSQLMAIFLTQVNTYSKGALVLTLESIAALSGYMKEVAAKINLTCILRVCN